MYKADEESIHFSFEQQIINLALDTYKDIIPNADYLILGESSICDPQMIIDSKYEAIMGEGSAIDEPCGVF